ncbi:TraB/GumN family protein [Variovorax sp. KK3]|uniref:TraB/GumN family protein n=1 Tax=Variovorax sp. KK3 TaxID=1855728 RepID=UPI002118F510|nr:TraB/GumN family protein [Variovorax sp. KK3]
MNPPPITPARRPWSPLLRKLALLALFVSAGAALAACPPAAPAPDLSQSALAASVDRGLLWRIDKDGRSSWLYGTLHLGKVDWALPGPRVRRALLDSDTLAMELDLQDPATVAAFAERADPALSERLLTPERRRRLARQAAEACLPESALAGLRPILQVTTLSLLAARTEGLYGDFGSELFLSGLARAHNKRVVALESAATQLKMLAGDSEAEEAEHVDQALDELESGRAVVLASELAGAWARSDWNRLGSYNRWCECVRTPAERRAMRRLLDERNPGLADGIARLHGSGQRVFGAVGALHMVGPRGLPALMAARGFRVTAVLPAAAPAVARP